MTAVCRTGFAKDGTFLLHFTGSNIPENVREPEKPRYDDEVWLAKHFSDYQHKPRRVTLDDEPDYFDDSRVDHLDGPSVLGACKHAQISTSAKDGRGPRCCDGKRQMRRKVRAQFLQRTRRMKQQLRFA